jgi:hypothetical protein
LKSLLPDHFTNAQCLKVAKALMHTTPQFFVPISYSEKSLIHNTIYDSPDEVYTFEDDVGDEEYPTGVYTALLPCYVRGCQRGGGGCYAPRCPNRTNRGGVLIVVNDTAVEVSIVQLFLYESRSINRTDFQAGDGMDAEEKRPMVHHAQNSFETGEIQEEEDTVSFVRQILQGSIDRALTLAIT